ncbi:carbohydrate deacetylase [Geoalkalibacter sp.]|uniref:carbohydrate deacetylase n=1 Tax=Geoalkalibacter sp. TaxID=3041440 RepID=UPI00272E2DD8|nr:ChbG/HpnK family deacetylase [Geoalkalibacter sp.]
MIRLIVNADDLGSGRATDRGIFHCFARGILTSASLLANGYSFAEAAREARTQALPLGVHFNLAEGQGLSGPIPGLTNAAGEFPGKASSRRALLSGEIATADLERELTAQISRVFDAGLLPDHADAHQHVCLFGPAGPAMIRVLKQFGLHRVRLPMPAEPADGDPGGELGRELKLYRALAPNFQRISQAAGLSTPDALWGMPLLNRLDEHRLLALLDQLPLGTWELMVHPGHLDPLNPFSGPERVREQRALCHPAVLRRIEERGIKPINFGELG